MHYRIWRYKARVNGTVPRGLRDKPSIIDYHGSKFIILACDKAMDWAPTPESKVLLFVTSGVE